MIKGAIKDVLAGKKEFPLTPYLKHSTPSLLCKPPKETNKPRASCLLPFGRPSSISSDDNNTEDPASEVSVSDVEITQSPSCLGRPSSISSDDNNTEDPASEVSVSDVEITQSPSCLGDVLKPLSVSSFAL